MADSTLLQEIIQEARDLSEPQQAEALAHIRAIKARTQFSLEEWLKEVGQFQEELRQKYGDDHTFNVQQTVDDIREEASWPRGS